MDFCKECRQYNVTSGRLKKSFRDGLCLDHFIRQHEISKEESEAFKEWIYYNYRFNRTTRVSLLKGKDSLVFARNVYIFLFLQNRVFNGREIADMFSLSTSRPWQIYNKLLRFYKEFLPKYLDSVDKKLATTRVYFDRNGGEIRELLTGKLVSVSRTRMYRQECSKCGESIITSKREYEEK